MTTQGETIDGQPVDTTGVGTVVGSDAPATIECWSCRNIFGIPSGTPNGSILACPICQQHNRFGGGSSSSGGSLTTAVVAMPVQSNTMLASGFTGERTRQLMTQMKCCWITTLVFGILITVGGLYFGATLCTYSTTDSSTGSDSTQIDTQCEGSIYKLYAFLIATGACMAGLGAWSLWELRTANINQMQGQQLYVKHFQLACHLGWILATIMFIYSVIFLIGFWWAVLFFPQVFTPCICGLVVGIVQWVNCCCYQNEFNKYQNAIQIQTPANVPLQSVQTQL